MKRTLLVVDSHKWCFGHIAHGIKKYAPDEYAVTVVDSSELYRLKLRADWHKDFDAVCQFSWTEASHDLPIRNTAVVAHDGLNYPFPYKGEDTYLSSVSTSIRNRKAARNSLPRFDHVIYFNPRLVSEHTDTYSVLLPGVDTEVFYPKARERHQDSDPAKKFVVGWAGQRGCRHKGEDLLHAVMQNMNRIDSMGFQFEWNDCKAIDPDVMSPEGMADWYRGLDAFLCTAASEGGPMTILEAAACGVPVISTPVGFAQEMSQYLTGPCVRPEQKSEVAGTIAKCILGLRNLPKMEYGAMCMEAQDSIRSWHEQAWLWLEVIHGEFTIAD